MTQTGLLRAKMNRSVGEHISILEQRLAELNNRLMETARTRAERNRIESEIKAAELTLDYYRKALELEQRIS